MKTRIDLFRPKFNAPRRRRWFGKWHGLSVTSERRDIVVTLCGWRWGFHSGEFRRQRLRTEIECKLCARGI